MVGFPVPRHISAVGEYKQFEIDESRENVDVLT